MSKFNYQVTPSDNGGFTTRAVLGDQLLQSTVTSAISTATGVEPFKVELVIKMFLDKLLDSASEGQWSPGIYHRLAFRPSCEGHLHTRQDTHSADEIGAGVTLAITSHVIREWRVGIQPVPVRPEKLPAKGHAVEQLSVQDAAGLLTAAG